MKSNALSLLTAFNSFTLSFRGTVAQENLSDVTAINKTSNSSKSPELEPLHESFDPDHRPKYDLKPRNDIAASFVSLDRAFELVLQYGSEFWHDASTEEIQPGKSAQCLPDESLCIHLTAHRAIPRQVEIWLVLEAFLANLDAHPTDVTLWLTQAYSYARQYLIPAPLVATVEFGPPTTTSTSGSNVTVHSSYTNESSTSLNDTRADDTASNASLARPKIKTNVDVKMTWYPNPTMTLSSLAWHLTTFLKTYVWKNDPEAEMSQSDWRVIHYTGTVYRASQFSLVPSAIEGLKWKLIEEGTAKLWSQIHGQTKGAFKSNWGLKEGGSRYTFANLYFRAVAPAGTNVVEIT